MATKLASEIKAGDQVVERDGALLDVVGVSRLGDGGCVIRIDVKRGGIFPVDTYHLVSPGTRIRVLDTEPGNFLEEAAEDVCCECANAFDGAGELCEDCTRDCRRLDAEYERGLEDAEP